MAEDPLESLRLSLMQDVLPVGLAMFDRAKKGGASKVAEVFADSNKPFQELREEGETAARSIRDRLDQVSPGLGNPVMSVTVDVNSESSNMEDSEEVESLLQLLSRIESRLALLEDCLQKDSDDRSFFS